jgi:hypothetical protein
VTSATGLRLNANYVAGDAWLNGTMTMSGNSVTVTVGSVISGTTSTGVTTLADLQWYSSTAATDVAGNGGTGNIVTEAGNDRDF